MSLFPGLLFLATCSMSFPARGSAGAPPEAVPGTVIRSDAMEMTTPEGGDTVFRFSGNVRVNADHFEATARELTAFLSGNPMEENASPGEKGAEETPHLTRIRAEGEVQIRVGQSEEERTGAADRVEVDPVSDVFVLSGHAQIQQKGRGTVSGERITLDRRRNQLKVGSDAAEIRASGAPPSPRSGIRPESPAGTEVLPPEAGSASAAPSMDGDKSPVTRSGEPSDAPPAGREELREGDVRESDVEKNGPRPGKKLSPAERTAEEGTTPGFLTFGTPAISAAGAR